MQWKDSLEQARALRKKGAALTYKRAKALSEVYKSDGFQTYCVETEQAKTDVLDDEVADLCCSFKTLMAVLHAFPNEADWKTTRLDILCSQALKKTEEKRSAARSIRISWKQKYLELEAIHDELQGKYDSLLSHFPTAPPR